VVATYRITVTNKTFTSSAEGNYGSDRDAAEQAVQGAIAIAADEIRKGEALFMADIKIERDGQVVGHCAVSVGCSPLA